MDVGVIGLGGGGNKIVDSLLSRELTEGTATLYKTIGIDSTKSGLAGLEQIPESQRVLVGMSQTGGLGTGSDLELGSDIIRNEEQTIAAAVSTSMIEDIDAYLIVTCAGGGMAGGASNLIELFQAITTAPVYVAVVLPYIDEGGLPILNATLNLDAIYPVADGVLVFDNENFYNEDTGEIRYDDVNETLSKRLLGLFSSVGASPETDSETGSRPKLDTILGASGIATVGYASEDVDTEKQGIGSRLFGEKTTVDIDEATEILASLSEAAVDEIGINGVYGDISHPALFISGPKSYLHADAVTAAKRAMSHPDLPEITVGTNTVSDSATLEVVAVDAGILEAPVLDYFERIYDEAYDGPEAERPNPPSFTNKQSKKSVETDGEISESSSTSQSDSEKAISEETETPDPAETSSPAVPDPSDVQGVDRPPKRTFDDVIGLADVKQRIREDVLMPARDERFDKYDIGSVTGVLFHGPPGTGKTYLAKATAGELGYNYMEVDPSDIKSQYVGGGAENISDLFERAKEVQPTLIFIDEIDSVAGERTEAGGGMTQSERSMVNELLGELSTLNESDDDIIVISATNTLDEVDSAIKRSGRFDTTIHIGAPDFETRHGILQSTLEDGPPDELDDIDADVLRSKTEGLVSSDIAELGKSSIRKAVAGSKPGTTPVVTVEHILKSIDELVSKRQQDSSAATMLEDPPETDFEDVAGMADLKRELNQTVIEPAENPDKYEKYGLDITNGVLLHGPPGTGKTYLSKAVAGELGFNFISITASDVVSKWIGEGTQNVSELFETALENQPSIIFIDEIDAIASQRGGGDRMHQDQKQIVNEVLTGMSDVQGEDVVVIAATNLLSSLDDALTRSGRFDETIEVPPPDDEARVEMLRFHLTDRPIATEKTDWEEIGALTRTDANGRQYVASDIKLIAETAARLALNDESQITQEHLRAAIKQTEASVSTYE